MRRRKRQQMLQTSHICHHCGDGYDEGTECPICHVVLTGSCTECHKELAHDVISQVSSVHFLDNTYSTPYWGSLDDGNRAREDAPAELEGRIQTPRSRIQDG